MAAGSSSEHRLQKYLRTYFDKAQIAKLSTKRAILVCEVLSRAAVFAVPNGTVGSGACYCGGGTVNYIRVAKSHCLA